MKKRKKRYKKDGKYTISSLEMTMAQKPYINAFSGGYGAHGSKKFSREKQKRKDEKLMKDWD